MQDKMFKVGMVGCGQVGMAAVYAMLIKGVATEMVLWGRDKKKVEGEKMDLDEAQPLMPKAEIVATDDFSKLKNADLVVLTAGAAQKSGQNRLDLAKENEEITKGLLAKILEAAPESVVLVVTNPVDVLTFKLNQLPGVKKGKVFGTGTMLDTMRFRHYLAEEIGVDAHNVHAYVLGEHGDHSFAAYEKAVIGGQRLLTYPKVSEAMVVEAYEKAKDSAYKIIEAKGATWWAIGMVIARIAEAIKNDEKVILPLSVPLDNYKGISGVALSVPCLLGAKGVEEILDVDLGTKEEVEFKKCAEAIGEYI